ncbi:hypothetical protein ACSVH2_05250 [Flavobacterium sp. RSB2_4_14]|uniref:hypothetical protein n=1 Tax=Flavobacterium sp. RSB2_4_14 TaxID=3447665 RepID=UPI003F2E37B3
MKNIFKYYLLAFVLVSDFAMYAQPGDDDGGGGLEGGDPAPAPINSKLVILAIVGVLFVLYTFRNNKRTV